MNDITPKEVIEILSHYTNLGYGIVIEGEDTSKIKQALSLASKTLANGTPYNPTGDCISRSALKKELQENGWITDDPYGESGGLEEIIDNAQTIYAGTKPTPCCQNCDNHGCSFNAS